MAAIEDIIDWCKQEQSRLARRLELLQSGQLRTAEKEAHERGWLEIDTTEQSIDLCRQYISEFNAIVARYSDPAARPASRPAPPRMVEPEPSPPEVQAPPRPLLIDQSHPGWVNGWGVVKGRQPGWQFAGIYATHAEADLAAAQAGEGYYARWGGYNAQTEEFISGPQ